MCNTMHNCTHHTRFWLSLVSGVLQGHCNQAKILAQFIRNEMPLQKENHEGKSGKVGTGLLTTT